MKISDYADMYEYSKLSEVTRYLLWRVAMRLCGPALRKKPVSVRQLSVKPNVLTNA